VLTGSDVSLSMIPTGVLSQA